MREYVIKPGDNFFRLAQQNGGCWEDYASCNPGIDPCCLQVGQKIVMPIVIEKKSKGGCEGYSGKGPGQNRCDDVFVEVEGLTFRVTRQGEPSLPHEVHLIIPRTEIRKFEHPATGIIETNIMLSNINIVNSPRYHGEGGGSTKIEQNVISNQNMSNHNQPMPDQMY